MGVRDERGAELAAALPIGIIGAGDAEDGALAERSSLGAALAVFDYGYLVLILLISSSAFTFLDLNSPLWALSYLLFIARIPFCYRDYLAFCRENRALTLYAALCLVSIAWSAAPAGTLHFALLVAATTAIALFLAMRFSLRDFFLISAWVYLFLMIASFANIHGTIHPAYNELGRFIGIFQSKNAIAYGSINFSLYAIFIMLVLRDVPIATRLVFLAGFVVTLYMATLYGSATASVMLVTFPVFSVWLAFVLNVRSGLFLSVMPVCLGLAVFLLVVMIGRFDPVTPVLALLGKDATLSGRTVLWQMGREAFLARPLLGFGADGFWQYLPNQPAIEVVRRLYGETIIGFHNLVVEMLVALGPLGLVAHLTIGAVGTARAIRCFRAERDPLAIWALVMIVALYVQAMVAPLAYAPHTISYITLVVLAATLGKRGLPMIDRSPGRRPPPG